MKKILILFLLLSIFSCSDKKPSPLPTKAAAAAKEGISVHTKIFGVGYSEDIAQTDSYSTYYAVLRGIQYLYSPGGIKLKLDNQDEAGQIKPEVLASAKTIRLDNGFYIFEYPYSGTLPLTTNKTIKTTASVTINKPFSYLSRMCIKCLTDNFASVTTEKKGILYITSINYTVTPDKGLLITADFLLTENPEVKFK